MKKIKVNVRYALPDDALGIRDIMHDAFRSYMAELDKVEVNLHALTETVDDILSDIKNHAVFVAVNEKNRLLGAIRVKELTKDLAYIYRFGVRTEIKNIGVGSRLLAAACDFCTEKNYKAIALHTNARFYTLARYYYGKRFFVHSTRTDKGYIRALFIKELTGDRDYDITPAHNE